MVCVHCYNDSISLVVLVKANMCINPAVSDGIAWGCPFGCSNSSRTYALAALYAWFPSFPPLGLVSTAYKLWGGGEYNNVMYWISAVTVIKDSPKHFWRGWGFSPQTTPLMFSSIIFLFLTYNTFYTPIPMLLPTTASVWIHSIQELTAKIPVRIKHVVKWSSHDHWNTRSNSNQDSLVDVRSFETV